MITFAGKCIAVVGMARSGIAAATLASRLGGKVLLSEQRELQTHAAVEELRALGIEVETGGHQRLVEDRFDVVILSPGVHARPEWLARWAQMGTEIWSEIELASRAFAGRWIGVTGSNGKTTTVHLIHAILQAAGWDVRMAGNVGSAWSGQLPAPETRVFVVELSSYQLERSPTIHPQVGVLLNLYENHLDRHGDMETYGAVKARMFANQTGQDVAILNGENAWVQQVSQTIKSRKLVFGSSPDADLWYDSDSLKYRGKGPEQVLIYRREYPLPGVHNIQNALAAAGAALALGLDANTVRRGLQAAQAVEHRIEFLVEKNGVRIYNDSKSTNLIATLTALNSFESNVILLFGGRAKPESFEPLAARYPSPLKHLIGYGESNDKVRAELAGKLPLGFANTLDAAVQAAWALAKTGDTILLSPGCASFDQFQDFEQRGHTFKTLVSALK